MLSEMQSHYVGKCVNCNVAGFWSDDEDRLVWMPTYPDCLHELPRKYEDMWRVVCRHGITLQEVEALKQDILDEFDINESPDQFEAILFALSKDSFMVKVVEHAH